jgi:acetyl-CoA carboxylase biotin carboxyl carrier protein
VTKKIKKKPSFKTLQKIFEMTEKYQIVEFEWENEKEKIKFKTAQHSSHSSVPSPFLHKEEPVLHTYIPSSGLTHQTTQPIESTEKTIIAPLVGTFYKASSPTAEPFVKVGQIIKPGDVLCIIEAMKLMNEIESDMAGKITSICVENGKAIEYGEPLFTIEPLCE